jgi:perosamine synthetase
MKVHLARPEITEADIAAVVSVLRSHQLSQGPILHEFENVLAAYLNVGHAVAVNSGTSALQLALRVLRIKEGDEVILPSFSFMAVTNAILSEKAVPVFVDIAPGSCNMALESLEAALSERSRAIIIVHSFGYPAPAAEIVAFARRHSLATIEDACEALGSERNGHKSGTIGDIGTLAFYPNKIITTGEGGALVTNSVTLADRLRSLRNQGRVPGTNWFQHFEAGFSCRISDINCALGLQQLARIESILHRREALAESYRARLRVMPGVTCFGKQANACRNQSRISWFTFPVLLNEHFTRHDRDKIWTELKRRDVESGRYFAPSHLQPALRGLPFRCGDLSETIYLSERLLCLPLFDSITADQIDFVCSSFGEIVSEIADRRMFIQRSVDRADARKAEAGIPRRLHS